MEQIRHDFATHDFKMWLAQLIQRVQQMHLPTSYAMERIPTWRVTSRRPIHHGKPAREEVGLRGGPKAKAAASSSVKRLMRNDSPRYADSHRGASVQRRQRQESCRAAFSRHVRSG